MTQPSWGFLKRGVTTESDRAAIAGLEALREEVGDPEYEDRSDDEALEWALALASHQRKDGEMDVEFQDIERDRDERLAEEAGEAGEAMIVDPDHPDHPVQQTLRERLRRDEDGQTMVEYAMLATLVAVVSIAALGVLRGAIHGQLERTGDSMACPNGIVEGPPARCAP